LSIKVNKLHPLSWIKMINGLFFILQSRERCTLPAQETRVAIGFRTAFSDMTRSMNAMPEPSLAPTSNLHPDCGAGQRQPRLAKNLQVAMPSQPLVSDELNTPTIGE